MRDVEGVRKRYELVAFISQDSGQKPTKVGGQYRFYCPFHKETTPSFFVHPAKQVWRCHGACQTGGDLFEYVRLRKYHNLSKSEGFVKALEDLDSGAVTPTPMDFTMEPEESSHVLTWRQVERVYSQVDKARDYFHNRAVADPVIETHKLGFTASHPWPVKLKRNTFPNGQDTWMVHSRRYAIPNFLGEDVRAINFRRDDAYLLAVLPMMDQAYVEVVMKELTEDLGAEPDWPRLRDELCPKYQKLKGSKSAIFGADLLVSVSPDSIITFRRPPYILVVESEMDKLALESLGYPAVAVPIRNSLDLKTAFHNVPTLYLLPHNDEAGYNRALDWFKRAARTQSNCRIPLMPKDFKDPSEMAQNGLLAEWLMKHEKLEPLT